MSKEATIIQSFNDIKRQYEYSVKGYDVTESVKILLKKHKEAYDKEKNVFAGIDGYLEAQNEYQSQISDLEAKLAESERRIQAYEEIVEQKDEEISFANRDKIYIVKQLNDPKNYVLLEDYKELKQQLAEKEKEIEELKLDNKKYFTESCRANKEIAYKLKQQNQKAIEQLEKVKDIILNERKITSFKFDIFNKGKDTALFWLNEQIDNQINELKGNVE